MATDPRLNDDVRTGRLHGEAAEGVISATLAGEDGHEACASTGVRRLLAFVENAVSAMARVSRGRAVGSTTRSASDLGNVNVGSKKEGDVL